MKRLRVCTAQQDMRHNISGELSETTAEQRGDRDDRVRILPGNPGRPKGSRHAALVTLDAIGAEGAERALRKVLGMAEEGDMRAAEILLQRLWLARKGRPVSFEMPEPRTAARAAGAVAQAVAAGELTPEEGRVSGIELD